jgi:3-deoxy-D-manno-octulosonic-acid transferase
MGGGRPRLSVWERIMVGVAGALGPFVVRTLGATWRVTVEHAEREREARACARPVVYACWHGQLLPLGYVGRGRGLSLLVSWNRDGEISARFFAALGYDIVRGSTSRGSARGAVAMLARMRDGRDAAMTPDGPRGPAGFVQPGTLYLAEKTGGSVLPVVAAASSVRRLSGWDRFMVPLPFARVAVVFGEPIPSGGDIGTTDKAALLKERLDLATREAGALVGSLRSLPEPGPPLSVSYRLYRALTNAVCFLAAPWAAAKRASRDEEWVERLGGGRAVPPGGVWVHAASVGEVAAAAPLMRALVEGGVPVLLTVLTRAGRDVAARAWGEGVTVAFAPLDFVPSVRSVLRRTRPRALLLVETELWPNLIVEAARAGAVVGVVNGRLSPRSAGRYLLPGSPVRGLGRLLSFVACQSDDDGRRFVALGAAASGVVVAGNMKYDALARPLCENERSRLRDSLGIPPSAPVVVFGSVRPAEEDFVAGAAAGIAAVVPGVFLIVAPRHLERAGPLLTRLGEEGLAPVRRSMPGPNPGGVARTIVLDSTGELSRVYSIATVAFVGGTLAPYGGHNPLEPAAHGVPVLIGPHTESCRDSAARLTAAGGAIVVEGAAALRDAALRLLSDEGARRAVGEAARAVVDEGRGATARTVELMRSRQALPERGAWRTSNETPRDP